MKTAAVCRFLLAKSDRALPAGDIFARFAAMAEKSRTPDGDRQQDGWGACWTPDGRGWENHKSLRPIWLDGPGPMRRAAAQILVLHARSASARESRTEIAFNQPFCEGPAAFVFNGLLRSVSLRVEGEIGSQKIWRLLSAFLRTRPPGEALMHLRGILRRHSAGPPAMNIGLSDGLDIYALGSAVPPTAYYALWLHRSERLAIISSEPLGGLPFEPLDGGEVIRF